MLNSTCSFKPKEETTSRSLSNLMSHPRAEEEPGVEAEVEEAEAWVHQERLKKIGLQEEDNSHSEDNGNLEDPEEEDKGLTRAPM